jgi:drug/metabolite transporter (DMT)-like permease
LGAVITSATPAFVVPCAYFLLAEKPSIGKLIGLALATAGVILVINPARDPSTGGGQNMLMGNALLVVAALTWALYSVMIKRATAKGMSALAATLGVTAWGIVFDAPLAALELRTASVGAITPAILAGIGYLGVVSTAIAFYLWNKGFELLDANTAALCFFAQPVTGALLGVLILHDPIGPEFMIGGMLIALGVLVSQIQFGIARGARSAPGD